MAERGRGKVSPNGGKDHAASSDGKTASRLSFDEKKPPSKLSHAIREFPADTIRGSVHRSIRETNDDNIGTDAADTLTETAGNGFRAAEAAHNSHDDKSRREGNRSDASPDKENTSSGNMERGDSAGYSSNPHSRKQQKRAIKKEYAAAKSGSGAEKTAETAESTAKKAAEKTKKVAAFVSRHKKAFLTGGAVIALILIVSSIVYSCSVMFEGFSSIAVTSTYPMDDRDMINAEAMYCSMEDSLREYIGSYESTHDYDEYRYDLDEIGHDPYVLLSALTALKGGNWTTDEISDELALLFEKQYILTETVDTQIRYRTEPRSETRWYYDPFSDTYYPVTYNYMENVSYEYRICTVKLENFDLSHVPVYIMSGEQLGLYSMYMASLGNRPDLFGDSIYVSMYFGENDKYDIPSEALSDERFAMMITEAEKYLGYPYVWGGSNPSTSFDCSGFVSWVCNNCGVGWNLGRLGAEGLRRICTPVSNVSVKPGDLVFFQGTYDTSGASHVGIYVGNGIMIHCGDPIQYSSINTSYWQEHFLSYGRLPDP